MLKNESNKYEIEQRENDFDDKLPTPPEEFQQVLSLNPIPRNILESYNEKATHIYQNISLKTWPGCNRTFNIEALKKHVKNWCKDGKNPFDKEEKKSKASPKAIICYICGRGYMQKSIQIHIKQCAAKFK